MCIYIVLNPFCVQLSKGIPHQNWFFGSWKEPLLQQQQKITCLGIFGHEICLFARQCFNRTFGWFARHCFICKTLPGVCFPRFQQWSSRRCREWRRHRESQTLIINVNLCRRQVSQSEFPTTAKITHFTVYICIKYRYIPTHPYYGSHRHQVNQSF